MRRAKLVLGASALMVAMLMAFSSPAMAQSFFFDDCDDFDFDGFCDDDFFDDDGFFFFDDFNDGLNQDFDQEAESGDIDQTFDVSNSGDNSNQTANLSGVSNTGNPQNQIGVTQFGSFADDFEFDGGGADLNVSGDSDVSSNQVINQAAAAGNKRH